MLILPGLIDMHVHLRDPGQTHKEDFYSGTSAALAGGFTTVVDMPNNEIPITTLKRLNKKIKNAEARIVCDVGFYFGSLGDNFDEFKKVENKVMGIKLYLDPTTGNFLIDDEKLEQIYNHWQSEKPILIHSEDESTEKVVKMIKKTGKRTHFCHVSGQNELSQIIEAKEDGLPVTCGVTPHYLFLDKSDVRILKTFAMMKHPLKSKKDRSFLWKNLRYIDVIESDHAPHTIEEKKSDNPPFGVPGLETTLPLLLTAEKRGKITMKQIITMCFTNPAKILNIKTDDDTKVEVDINKEYEIKGGNFHTKSKWTPFEGWRVRGKVVRLFIRGTKVFEDGKVLVNPGFGKVISS